MKKIMTFLMAFMMVIVFSVTVGASGVSRERVLDYTGELSLSEVGKLNSKLSNIADDYNFDVIVCLVDGLPAEYYDEMSFADDLADDLVYNYGYSVNNCLLLFDKSDNGYAISTSGYGETAFTVAGCEYIIDQIGSNLKSGKYYKAFDEFAEQCDDFLKQAKKGKPYDEGNLPKDKAKILKKSIGIGLIIGAVITALIMLGLYGKMKNVAKKTQAREYVVDGTFNVSLSRDSYLYSKTTRTKKPSQSSGSGSHTSSSGSSHGGISGHL